MKNFLLFTLILFSFSTAKAQFGPFIDMVSGDVFDPLDMIPIDFDMDGDMDVVVRGEHHIYWIENLGSGDFSFGHEIGLIEATIDFAVVDFDMDGDYDIPITNDSGMGTYLRNLGDGTFEEVTILELVNGTLFEAVDFDADGDPDLVSIKEGSIVWLEGDGTGAIIAEHELETLVFDEADFTLADTDNDSDLDIIWCSYADGGKVFFMENLGGGIFDDRETADSGMTYPSSVVACDVDGDLDLDIVYGSWTFIDGGEINWIQNMGDGTFSGTTLISADHDGETHVASGDIDMDGDADLMACSANDSKVSWYENTGLAAFEEGSLMATDIDYANAVLLGDFDADGDLDGYALGIFPGNVGWFENATLNPLHVEGQLYYDENENGIMDGAETGFPWAAMVSDPDGTMAVTHPDGTYSISFVGLADGDYEIFPELVHWGVTSAYSTYDVEVSDDFTFMDTLDFGMFPSEYVDSLGTDLTGGQFPRCSDTVGFWLSVNNLGTTFPSGVMHLELDDSLYYVTADILPDSIDGQHIYWSYETLFFFEVETFLVQVGTPDGLEDTLSSILTSTVVEAGATVFSASDELEQIVVCAYDPNDKTPDPMGEGPEGSIPASTEWIEYTVRFQNTGTDYAEDVLIRDQLDEDLIWTSIQPLFSSHGMVFEFDPSGEVSFIFDNIILPDSNSNEIESHGFVKYRIQLKPDLAVGTTIENTANIYFDFNPAVITNTAINTIAEPSNIGILTDEPTTELEVYPNPADDFVYVVLNKEMELTYVVRLYNAMGQVVYSQENVNTGLTKINTSNLDKGLYVIMIESSDDHLQLYNSKLIIK